MVSKNYVLNQANISLKNGALNLPCRLMCLWPLFHFREQSKTFCAKMKVET